MTGALDWQKKSENQLSTRQDAHFTIDNLAKKALTTRAHKLLLLIERKPCIFYSSFLEDLITF